MKTYRKDNHSINVHIARILSILMILSLLTGGFALTGAGPDDAYSYAAAQAESDYEYTVSGGSVTLTSYNGTDSEPVIPSSIGGRNVTAIGEECFRGNAKIKKIVVPEGITAIGDYAFEACSSASELVLPSTLKTIGKAAFSGDGQLKELSIPDSVQRIDDGAFLYCIKLGSVTGGTGLAEIGEFVFAGCTEMAKADLSRAQLTVLPDRTFCNCESLFEVKLPDSIETVGKRAFSNCRAVETIELGGEIKTVADYAFENCSNLQKVSLGTYSGLKLGDYLFTDRFGSSPIHLRLPDNTEITDKTLYNASLGGIYVDNQEDGEGNLISASGSELTIIDGQIYEDNGTVLANAFPEKFDNGSWVKVIETVSDGTHSFTRYTVPDSVLVIASGAFGGTKFGNVVIPASVEEIDAEAFFGAKVKSAEISGDNSRYIVVDGMLCEKLEVSDSDAGNDDNDAGNSAGDAAAGTDKYRLVRFFAYKVQDDALVRTTREVPDSESEFLDPKQEWDLPDNVVSIAPYAFYNSGINLNISDNTSLQAFEDNSFSYSGIGDPRKASEDDYLFVGKIDIKTEILDSLSISETAFENSEDWDFGLDDDENENNQSSGDFNNNTDTTTDTVTDNTDGDDRFARIRDDIRQEDGGAPALPDDGDEYVEPDPIVKCTSHAGNKSLYSEKAYSSYKEILNSKFTAWSDNYLDYNKDAALSPETMPYTMLYKGEAHYRSMVCVLNHDQYKYEYSVKNVGDDFEKMYLTMDHGLEAEMQRGKVPGDIVLYSGITVERMADIAGITDKSVVPTEQQLIDAIGREFTDPAFMSTTTNPRVAASFSSYSETMVIIYASEKSLSQLGAVCLDSFSGWGAGEYEILLNLGAKFRVLDVGSLTVGTVDDPENYRRTFVRLKLVGPDDEDNDDVEPADNVKPKPAAEPVVPMIKTVARSGKKMQVKWTKVNGAVSYKLQYRKAGTSKWKTVSVKGTSKTLTKMKTGGLYQFRVASVDSNKKTGKYSKPEYRYYKKTRKVRYKARKTSVKVRWKKTKGASGYLILVSPNKDLKGAKVITVNSGKKKSKVVKGLESGKKYYFSIRPYKTKGKNRYIGIRSKIRKVKTR